MGGGGGGWAVAGCLGAGLGVNALPPCTACCRSEGAHHADLGAQGKCGIWRRNWKQCWGAMEGRVMQKFWGSMAGLPGRRGWRRRRRRGTAIERSAQLHGV